MKKCPSQKSILEDVDLILAEDVASCSYWETKSQSFFMSHAVIEENIMIT